MAATAMSSYGKRKDVDGQLDSEGELPTHNSFCRRSLLVQETFSVHKIRLQSITIEFPIQMYKTLFQTLRMGVRLYRKSNRNEL